jgi:hypothetical protein
MAEQNLAPVDVTDPSKHRLVHQQFGYRPGAARDPVHRQVRIGSRDQRVGPKSGLDLVDLLGGDHLAHSRSTQVPHPPIVEQPEPDLPLHRDGAIRPGHDRELADQTKVNVQPALLIELREQVLTPGEGLDQDESVQLSSTRRETCPAD